ncbi:MAG: hypothetical protein AAF394_17380, partial [Planctomycetota bacterium]
LVCVVLTTLIQTIDRTFFRTTAKPTPTSTAPQSPGPNPAPQNSGPSAESIRRQHRDALVAIEGALSASKNARENISIWNKQIEPLQDAESTGEMTEKQIEQLAYIFNRNRTEAEEIDRHTNELKILQQQIEPMKNATPPEAISTSEVERIQKLSQAMLTAKSEWLSSVEQARAVLRQSATDENEQTLRKQVSQAKDRETLAALDRERESGPVEAAATADVHIETFDSSEELREQAMSTEVASVLAPFLESRNIQPSLAGSFSIKFKTTFDEGPMSLGKIRSIGALDESVAGLKKLALLGGNRKLPEPRWSVASQPGNWSEADQELLKKAQRMLIDLGDTLVQEGKLLP